MTEGRSPESGAMVGPTGAERASSDAESAPSINEPDRLVVWQLLSQARACQVMGSPLATHLLVTAAQDVVAGGPTALLLVPRARPGRGDAAALRFLAAVHRLVLTRQAPHLAMHYPSVGGTVDLAGVGAAFLQTVADHRATLEEDVERPCQTNEPGRAAGLLVGLLEVSAITGLPLSLREVGASAGLNLRMDRWRYDLPDGHVVGDPNSELRLADRWRAPIPHAEVALRVIDRRGCDLRPIDPTTPEGRLALSASVWPDQTERFARLGAAIRIAANVPAPVDFASAAAWVAEHARPVAGRCTVVFHSIVEEYLEPAERAALHTAMAALSHEATTSAPLAWLRMEPSSELRHHTVRVRLWPAVPVERHLARTGAHGDEVIPLDG